MTAIAADMRAAITASAALAEGDAALSGVAHAVAAGQGQSVTSGLNSVSTSLARIAGLNLGEDVAKPVAAMRRGLDDVGAARTPDLARALANLMAARAEAGKALAASLESIHGREAGLLASNRQNKILIALLTLFVVGQILIREYRWLAVPMARMAHAMRTDGHSAAQFGAEAMRRDEIGTLAQALNNHFALSQRQQKAASEEKEKLSERLSRQDAFKLESIAFQDRISGIVNQLETIPGGCRLRPGGSVRSHRTQMPGLRIGTIHRTSGAARR